MNDKKLYIISEDIMTDGMKKTIKVKAILESGKVQSITKATQMVGLSRAAYYKYKDSIHKVGSSISDIICILLFLEDKQGVLSNILDEISASKGNILTINQEIPLGNSARVSIYLETKSLIIETYELVNAIGNIDGVKRIELASGGN